MHVHINKSLNTIDVYNELNSEVQIELGFQ